MAQQQNNQTSQNNTPDTQNYNVDIDKIYTDFVVEIDKIRSHLSVVNNPIFNTLSASVLNQINITTNVNQQVQESRCSAFYRLLGLPVTDGNKFYNPGFDLPNNSNQALLKTKTDLAQNILSNFDLKNCFDARETLPTYFLGLFGLQDVEAMVLTMGLNNIRPIATPFNNVNGIIDTNLNHQTYSNSLISALLPIIQNNGRTAVVSSSNGGTLGINASNSHLLAPLAVDPRIDFYVFPQRNRLAVPFLKDKSQTKLSDNIYLKRPYIEKVCRDRFNTSNTVVNYGETISAMIDSIRSLPFINNDQLLSQAFNPNGQINSETVQFANYFNSIRSVLGKLYSSIMKIAPVLVINSFANYNWTPIPSREGPEKGCTTRDLFNGQSGDPNNTDQDLQILTMQYQQTLNTISNKLTTLQAPDLGGFAFDNTELTPDTNSSTGFGNNIQDNIDHALMDRNTQCDAANEAVRYIEIIMGEFSGLGLLDILVISSAFWLVDNGSLLSMLDDTAFQRLYIDPTLRCPEVINRENGAGVAFKDGFLKFQKVVADIYKVCDQLWDQIIHENVQ